MSILESIQKAEAKAEGLKNEAYNKVEVLLKESKVKVEGQVKVLFEELENKKRTLDQKAVNTIANKETELDIVYSQEDENTNKVAQANLEKTANHIIEKVLLV